MKKTFALIIAIFFTVPGVLSLANWQIKDSTFACSPDELVVGSDFSCSAQIENIGDESGTIGTAELHADPANEWFSDQNGAYPVVASLNEVLSSGESTEVTWSNMKAIVTGINEFSRVMLDSITDSSGVEDVSVNVISVVVSSSASVSSAESGDTSIVTAEVAAGGDIDVDLTFSGCTISGQEATKSFSLQNNNAEERSWTVTIGASSCNYRVTAIASGANSGQAQTSDTTTGTITCTDCSSGSSSSSSSSGGGGSTAAGGGGGGGGSESGPSELAGPRSYTLEKNQRISFTIGISEHFVTLLDFTETSATFLVQSSPQEVTLNVGETKAIDLNSDKIADISITLNSINPTKGNVRITIAPLSAKSEAPSKETEPEKAGQKQGGKGFGIPFLSGNIDYPWLIGLVGTALFLLFAIVYSFKKKRVAGKGNHSEEPHPHGEASKYHEKKK
ncbi:hypothetical protein J4401_03875 [Candidatus Woesearchaeota archaeon]|nr:hypothetical protein [Candidatus Woesearchaeota archaeon]